MLKDMKEELIKFETAKLAKEKGFCLNTNFEAYALEDLFQKESPSYKRTDLLDMILESESEFFIEDKIAYAPTQSLLQKWLREEYHIYVGVHPLTISACDKSGYRFTWYACKMDGEIEKYDNTPLGYLTYEEALEEGLFEALKLI